MLFIEFLSISTMTFLFSMMAGKTSSYMDDIVYILAIVLGAGLGRVTW